MDCVALLRIINDLEAEIADWRTKNSQSNPGAMMELRETRRKLAAHTAAYKKLMAEQAAKKKVESDTTK